MSLTEERVAVEHVVGRLDDVPVGEGRAFVAGERIHTENSYKYQQADAIALLERSGFEATRVWTDPQRWFAVIHAQAIR